MNLPVHIVSTTAYWDKAMLGQTISHYKIIAELGRGGMGIVYKAEDTKLRRLVALKFLPDSSMYDRAGKERLFHEARAARLGRPRRSAPPGQLRLY